MLTTCQLRPSGRVEVGSKHGERGHRTVLGKRQLQSARNLLHSLDLRVTTNTGDGDTNVNRRALVGVEKVRLQEDLAVGD